MKQLFDEVSIECSKITTKKYSTSFSIGIMFLNKRFRHPIYAIYGFVRLADEVVDSFEGYDKRRLLALLKQEVYEAIDRKISLNPIINAYQEVFHRYNISEHHLNSFLISMEMDLDKKDFNPVEYSKYIFGSAEAVGLMCLSVFTENNSQLFNELKPYAQKLGSAFQKVNFLRDIRADNVELGRSYFPDLDLTNFTNTDKYKIEEDIQAELKEALSGILQLPTSSRKGVYLAYYYYTKLFKKIKKESPQEILKKRIRVPNYQKYLMLLETVIKLRLYRG
jgi:phytoene synthase